MDNKVTVVGLVSDTHGVLDSPTINLLKEGAVTSIIHAGDVGDARRKGRLSAEQVLKLLEESTGCAVIAVAGNVDEGHCDLPTTWVATIAGIKLLVMHICGFPPKVSKESQQLIDTIAPQIVIFGHSHVPRAEKHENVLYINPGSAGPSRFRTVRCIALLYLQQSGMVEVDFRALANSQQDVGRLPESLKLRLLD